MTFKGTYVRKVIKFQKLLGKMPYKCNNLLKKGLGTHASSYETIRWWVDSTNMGEVG